MYRIGYLTKRGGEVNSFANTILVNRYADGVVWAHEIGHVKLGHVKRYLGVTIADIYNMELEAHAFARHYHPTVRCVRLSRKGRCTWERLLEILAEYYRQPKVLLADLHPAYCRICSK